MFDALWSSTNYGIHHENGKWHHSRIHTRLQYLYRKIQLQKNLWDLIFCMQSFITTTEAGMHFHNILVLMIFYARQPIPLIGQTASNTIRKVTGSIFREVWASTNTGIMQLIRNIPEYLVPGTGIELVKVQIVTSVNSSLSKTQPAEFILEPNYPNPFNPSTTIIYNLPQSAHVDLSIYNIQGQCIQKLVNGYQTGGTYSVQWNGRYKGIAAASGVYFARLNTEGKKGAQSQVQRMVLLK